MSNRESKNVRLVQCLCPARHCIVAVAFAPGTDFRDDREAILWLQARVEKMLAGGGDVMNPWCGICRAAADRWRYEVAGTRFGTLEEAWPALKLAEAMQRHTAEVMARQRRTENN